MKRRMERTPTMELRKTMHDDKGENRVKLLCLHSEDMDDETWSVRSSISSSTEELCSRDRQTNLVIQTVCGHTETTGESSWFGAVGITS